MIEFVQKFEDCTRKLVVLVGGNHVPGAGHIRIRGMRDQVEKVFCMIFLHQLGGRSPDQKHGHFQASRRRRQ